MLTLRTTVGETESYAVRLKAAITRSGLSTRQVAKQLAERTGNPLDDERSAVYRYLKTQEPAPARARHFAEILDAPELADVRPANARRSRRAEALEAEVADLGESVAVLLEASATLVELVEALGGEVPKETLDALRRAVGNRQP